MKTLIIAAAAAALLSLGVTGAEKMPEKTDTAGQMQGTAAETVPEAPELLAAAESEEAAEEIAAAYGITLAGYTGYTGIATFWNTSGMQPGELIRLGKENGWPPIEINQTTGLF